MSDGFWYIYINYKVFLSLISGAGIKYIRPLWVNIQRFLVNISRYMKVMKKIFLGIFVESSMADNFFLNI